MVPCGLAVPISCLSQQCTALTSSQNNCNHFWGSYKRTHTDMHIKSKLISTFVASKPRPISSSTSSEAETVRTEPLSELISIMNTASSVLTTCTHTRTRLAVILNDRTRSREHLLSMSSSVTDLLNAEDEEKHAAEKHILRLKWHQRNNSVLEGRNTEESNSQNVTAEVREKNIYIIWT